MPNDFAVNSFDIYIPFFEERTSFKMYLGIGGATLSTEKDSLDDFSSFPSRL
jgi:hypothetical protein